MVTATHQLLLFGVFELNLTTEELRKSDILVKLPPQPFRLLARLASRAGQVVSREEIQRQFWGDETEIDFERRMNQCIKQIRTALGDRAGHPLYIETVHRQGYRFIAPVESRSAAPSPPKLTEARPSGIENAIADRVLARLAVSGHHGADITAAVRAVASTASLAADTTFGRRRSKRTSWVLIAAAVLAAGISGGLYLRTRSRPVLTEKDTIVLADFDNKTGDPVFDGTLRQGLWADLQQSPFLNMLSDLRIAQTMALMAQPKGAAVTAETAREICVRTASAASLEGTIALFGRDYAVSLRAVNCQTGDEIAVEQFIVDSKEKILPALGQAASQLRQKLGESLSSVQKYAVPLIDATTPSLQALQAYTLGRKARFAKGNTAALPFFERAAALDPTFAMLYRDLSVAYGNLNQAGRAAENARKAYALRDKVSEPERFSIDSNYYARATGELDKAAQTYKVWQQTYPRDSVPYTNLADIYSELGKWEESLSEVREAMRLEPNNSTNYVNLGVSLVALNRLEEAEAIYKRAEEHGLGGEVLIFVQYQLAFLKGDTVQMEHLATIAKGEPGTEGLLLASQADTEAWFGRLRQARELTGRALDSAEHNDARETGGAFQAVAALREVESGNPQQARAAAYTALKLAPNNRVTAMAAIALALAGEIQIAQKLASELDRTAPLDALVQTYWLPAIRAAIALQRKDPERAVEELRGAMVIELSQPTTLTLLLAPPYLRGEAYLMLRDGTAAAAEFQKLVDHRGVVGNFQWGALARLGLARAYALDAARNAAARDNALAAYQNFLALWKDADPAYLSTNTPKLNTRSCSSPIPDWSGLRRADLV